MRLRTRFFSWGYRHIMKPIFFRQDPEVVHDRMISIGAWIGRHNSLKAITRAFFDYENSMLAQDILGMKFRNPVGLGAGFDKNAQMTEILPSVGFGFVEVGSITTQPFAGNAKPRLWRLPEAQSLVVNYGLKNDGVDVIVKRLQEHPSSVPLGTNIARTNVPETASLEAGTVDYATSFEKLAIVGDYMVVNISCPNTCHAETFVTPEHLDALLTKLDAIPTTKPVFIKFAPDLGEVVITSLIQVSDRHRVHGFITTNLTKDRTLPSLNGHTVPEKGGLSGKIVEPLSNEVISLVYRLTGGKKIIIGLGGVFSAEDAYEKIKRGASLVQLVTGMIFRGPQLIGEINQGLVDLLKKDGYNSISEAIGKYHRV